MIIYSNLKRLLYTFSFVLIFPLIQKQWFNLYSFNINSFSFYSFLYYISGIIYPIIVSFYSLSELTYYKFDEVKTSKIIKGKSLLLLILSLLVTFSFLIINYFYFNFNLVSNIFLDRSFFLNINYLSNIYFILITCILLIFRKSRIFIKKLVLINFVIFSLVIWHSEINNLINNNYISTINNAYLENLNYINVLFLFSIELINYVWSYISNKNNLSNWFVPIPPGKNIYYILEIFIYFFLSILYYSILK